MASVSLEPTMTGVIDSSAALKVRRAPAAVAMLAHGLADRAAHEVATLQVAITRIGALLGLDVVNAPADAMRSAGCYCVPIDTLPLGLAAAHGIRSEHDLWGGIVPHDFVATKLVSHPLWFDASEAPRGWIDLPGIDTCTLPGYSVFTRPDARAAGLSLLAQGPVRIKCPHARGGHGQDVVTDRQAWLAWLDAADAAMLTSGLVLERDLVASTTYSVGSSDLPGHAISYHGTQRMTRNGSGELVYGGSVLHVRAGVGEAMLHDLGDDLRAVAQAAMRYDDIVRGGYGVVASRRNYDVIEGIDAQGRRHVGVLEQSWRFGGASMAEVLAMEAFARSGAPCWLTSETVETYAAGRVPDEAIVTWDGRDDLRTPLKYARIVQDGCRP